MSTSKPISILFAILFAMPLIVEGQIFLPEFKEVGPEFSYSNFFRNRLECEDFDLNGFDDCLNPNFETLNFLDGKENLEFEYSFEEILSGFDVGAESGVEIIDFDLDGYKDIVFLDDNSSFWFIKNIQGAFENEEVYLITTVDDGLSQGSSFDFVDLDKDGDFDLVYLSSFSNSIKVLFNTDTGFNNEEVLFELVNPSSISSYQIYDIDNDGDFDLTLLLIDEGQIDLAINNGDNTFATKVLSSGTYFVNPRVFPMLIDEDGLFDFFMVDLAGGGLWQSFSWIQQTSNGNFVGPIGLDFEMLAPHVDIADIDLDGDLDVVASSRQTTSPEIAFFRNLRNGAFEIEVLQKFDTRISEIELIDIDGDEDLDIVNLIEKDNQVLQLVMIENLIIGSKLQGCVFFDENENGIKDGNEQNLDGVQIDIAPQDLKLQTNENGCYSYFVEDGTYRVSHDVSLIWRLTTDSASYTVTVDGNSISNLDFGFAPTEQLLAGQMHAVSGITRCNREANFDFIFQNMGTTLITEGVVWAFPDDLVSLASEIDPIDTIGVTGEWGWKFENLLPGQTIKRSVLLNIPGLGGVVDPGTLIKIFSATEAMDTRGFVNFFKNNFESEILCAYDPNDKLVNPDIEGDENYTQFKDTMIYTVRFQNTGNDTAFTVVIRDTLDVNLDESTFNILASSHREVLQAEILEDKYVTFSFEDILLPDSTIDFNGSQGYVSYSIEPKDGIPENTIIENTASIFFDFNPPIVTNTTQNTMVECLPINQEEVSVIIGAGETYALPDGTVVNESGSYVTNVLDEDGCPLETVLTVLEVLTSTSNLVWNRYVNVVPNPARDFFYLDIETINSIDHEMIVFNILGEEIYRQQIQNKSTRIELQSVVSGTYMVQLVDKQNNVVAVKKMVVL